MNPERWHEIERLYHAARERRPEDREAFLLEACAGNESVRKEVESLLAYRPKAEKFMEAPPMNAGARVAAEIQSKPSADVSHDHTAAASVQTVGRRTILPLWILLLSVPFVACAAFIWFQLFFGPEPVGWVVELENAARAEGWIRITTVRPKTPAARAGFQSGDIIPLNDLDQLRAHGRGSQLRFEVRRRGEGMELTLTFQPKGREYWLGSEGFRAMLLIVDSVLCLVLAGALVILRPQDSLARWGAILLAQLGILMLMAAIWNAGTSCMLEYAHALRALPLPVALAILAGMSIPVMVPAGAYGFLGGFPRNPLMGWRAWLFTWIPGIVVTIPIDLKYFWLPVYAGANGPWIPVWLLLPGWLIGECYLAAGIVLLIRNYRKIEELNERRRMRMVVAGFGIGVFAMGLEMIVILPLGTMQRFKAYWMESHFESAFNLLFALAPVCTAYAILRHRMFDIHVMIRLGLRYAAARGLLLSIIPATGLVLALDLLTHGNQPLVEIARRRGLLYVAIALGAFLLHIRQKSWLNALDRRFFREHYDARRLLSAVVDDVRRADTFDQAAAQVITQIEGSLHPQFAGLLVREPEAGSFFAVAPAHCATPPISADSKLIAMMKASGKPLENSQSQPGWLQQQLPPEDVEYLQKNQTEWLFPVTLGPTGREAVLVLGPKRSEEPYSQEDREILSAIAASLALLLERSPAPGPVQVGFGECPKCGQCYDSGIAFCATDSVGLSNMPYSLTLARRYRLEQRLGRGGMGTVYRAKDTELQRLVAVKVIRPELMPGMDAVARFRWEAKAAAGFAHQNVVTVYDFGVAEDNRAYLVMELLSGSSLRQELLRCGRLEPKRVLAILTGVSSAITAAHERRLLHRDLKPENIFLARSGEADVAKILDFGLAKMMVQDTEMGSVPSTIPGMLIGTLPYMSPERIRGGAPMESWDIWALAVMAFEMLTGVHPFSTLTTWGSMVAEDHFPPIEENAPALTAPLKQFFKRSLAVDRAQRPPSAHRFIVELQATL
jgi:eukaryotic-like serine/threonine-protein kinase